MTNVAKPKVSIITPSYNGVDYLETLLQSIDRQTYDNWEHIIFDNCSTDKTHKILEMYADSRRKVIVESDRGQSNALNKGFAQSTGDIICWINVDDYYYSNDVIKEVVNELSSSEHQIVFGKAFWRYEPEGIEISVWIDSDTSNFNDRFTKHLGLCQPSVFWKRCAYQAVGELDESLHYAMDFEYWCRMYKAGMSWKFSDQYFATHRVHKDMKTVSDRGRSLIETIIVVLKEYGIVSDEWVGRLVDYYNSGCVGLQNDSVKPQLMSNSEAERLREILPMIFLPCDNILLRAYVSELAFSQKLNTKLPIMDFFSDLLRTASCGYSYNRLSFDRSINFIKDIVFNLSYYEKLSTRTTPSPLVRAPLDDGKPIEAGVRNGDVIHKDVRVDKSMNNFQFQRLLRFKNRYLNQECVLLCNGPSLKSVDFTLIQNRFIIGLNKIYLGKDLVGRLPDLVVAVNKKVIEQSVEQFESMPTLKFLGSRAGLAIPIDPLTFYFKSADSSAPRFSRNIIKEVHEGWTVTHAALQVAHYLGFSKVIIVGMDHNFPGAYGKPNESQVMPAEDTNHFVPNYFGYGQSWDLPDLENSEISYASARSEYEKDGRLIIDATKDGCCNIFVKMSLAEALDFKVEIS
ncbi:MAG: glycosyltransferase [Pseudohongiella sp.]|uniref:glycosyltransferase n=1 Tax=Pseudohongiella sp. TaxID=1979412 RepID=UPI00349FF8F3